MAEQSLLTTTGTRIHQRSMAVDSEINIATIDRRVARDLRKRVWRMHSGGLVDGGGGTKAEIVDAFEKWGNLMKANRTKKLAKQGGAKLKKMIGFLLPLEDSRSSTIRLG